MEEAYYMPRQTFKINKKNINQKKNLCFKLIYNIKNQTKKKKCLVKYN